MVGPTNFRPTVEDASLELPLDIIINSDESLSDIRVVLYAI
jgi:hypothetical protein